MLARKLSAMRFIARIEPTIPTVEGTKIQDLCAWKDSAYAVGSDTADLDKIHFSKVSKYDLPGIHQWIKESNPVSESQNQKGNATTLILNWRGAISEESWRFWRRFGVSRRFLMWTSIITMQETYKIWQTFKISRRLESQKTLILCLIDLN